VRRCQSWQQQVRLTLSRPPAVRLRAEATGSCASTSVGAGRSPPRTDTDGRWDWNWNWKQGEARRASKAKRTLPLLFPPVLGAPHREKGQRESTNRTHTQRVATGRLHLHPLACLQIQRPHLSLCRSREISRRAGRAC
jgi:hypothetical protein